MATIISPSLAHVYWCVTGSGGSTTKLDVLVGNAQIAGMLDAPPIPVLGQSTPAVTAVNYGYAPTFPAAYKNSTLEGLSAGPGWLIVQVDDWGMAIYAELTDSISLGRPATLNPQGYQQSMLGFTMDSSDDAYHGVVVTGGTGVSQTVASGNKHFTVPTSASTVATVTTTTGAVSVAASNIGLLGVKQTLN